MKQSPASGGRRFHPKGLGCLGRKGRRAEGLSRFVSSNLPSIYVHAVVARELLAASCRQEGFVLITMTLPDFELVKQVAQFEVNDLWP